MRYRFPVISVDSLDPVIRARLEAYVSRLARRSGMAWHIERVSKPGREYRAMLVSENGDQVYVHYLEARSWEPRPRWKSEQTSHVVRGKSELVSVETLEDRTRHALGRYIASLERRTGARWHVLRLLERRTARRRRYHAVLLGGAGRQVIVEYSESPRKGSARWIKRR